MSRRHWFLADAPDVLGLLRRQVGLTVQGIDAFAAWAAAGGDAQAAATVHALEHEADVVKHELRSALSAAFVTPLDPEDLFALSRGIDWILNHAKDAIGESEAMHCPPDAATATMAALLAQSVRHIDDGVARIATHPGDADEAADAAVKSERRLEKAYRAAMGALAERDDVRMVMGLQELYRRCSRMGETAVDVAERLIYAAIKES
ncbi:MAG: hypothetical protein QOE31_510 [Solirubrobacteraceae bacterium]|nr:hypothetical protein [Solirubrobacteraceae bacterium]